MGTYYDRLTEVAGLDFDQSDENASYRAATELIQQCLDLATAFRSEPGMTGATATAALEWLSEYEKTLTTKATELETMHTRQGLARDAMRTAKQAQASLPQQLLTPFESKILPLDGPYTLSSGETISGPAYVAQIRAQRELERERASKAALETMNDAVNEQRDLLQTPVRVEPQAPTTTSTGGGGPITVPRSSSSAPKYQVVAPVTSPTPSLGTTTPSPTPVETTPYPVITSPTPDGPVGGGYTPPSIHEVDDPRWSQTYVPPGSSGGGSGGVMLGGVLGAGAGAVAARALGAGMPGSAALAFQTAAGAGNAAGLGGNASLGATVRAPGGGMLTSAATRSAAAEEGAAAGAAGRGAAGRGAASSTAGRSAAGRAAAEEEGAAGRSAAAGRGAATSRGQGSGRNAAGATGNSSNDKRKRKQQTGLVGYLVDRLEVDEAYVPVDHPAVAAGTSAGLEPLHDADDGERW